MTSLWEILFDDRLLSLAICRVLRMRLFLAFGSKRTSVSIIPLPTKWILSGAMYNGPQNLDSVISYTWEIKGGGPSGTNAKEVSAFI